MLPACLSIDDASAQLGVSRSTTRRLIASNELAVVRVKRRVLVPSREIEDFIARAVSTSNRSGSAA